MNMFDSKGVYRTVLYKETPEFSDFIKGSQFCHAGCMIRADVLKEVGLYNVSKKFNRVEDYELWVRMYLAGYKGYNIQEALYSMRDDRNAKKRRNFSNRINESRVAKKVFKSAKLPFYKYPLVFVPIMKFFVPAFVYKILHKK